MPGQRVGDLQAYPVNESCLEIGPAYSHITRRPWPGYVLKVPNTPFQDQVVDLQTLPVEEADPAFVLLCPVRTLCFYVECTQSFRCSDQLFVCFGGQQKGETVALAYQTQSKLCPLGVRAHYTESVASSLALPHSPSLADRAAGRATPNTFARFYHRKILSWWSHFPPVCWI